MSNESGGCRLLPYSANRALRRDARICGLLLALIIRTTPAFSQLAIPQFTMDSINIRQEGIVGFSALALGADARSDFAGPCFLVGETDDHSFRVYARPEPKRVPVL